MALTDVRLDTLLPVGHAGSEYRFRLHLHLGETPCDECRAKAYAARQRRYQRQVAGQSRRPHHDARCEYCGRWASKYRLCTCITKPTERNVIGTEE